MLRHQILAPAQSVASSQSLLYICMRTCARMQDKATAWSCMMLPLRLWPMRGGCFSVSIALTPRTSDFVCRATKACTLRLPTCATSVAFQSHPNDTGLYISVSTRIFSVMTCPHSRSGLLAVGNLVCCRKPYPCRVCGCCCLAWYAIHVVIEAMHALILLAVFLHYLLCLLPRHSTRHKNEPQITASIYSYCYYHMVQLCTRQ